MKVSNNYIYIIACANKLYIYNCMCKNNYLHIIISSRNYMYIIKWCVQLYIYNGNIPTIIYKQLCGATLIICK